MRVQIKTWEEMEKLDKGDMDDNDLKLPSGTYFTTEMEYYMPNDRIIEVFENDTGLWWSAGINDFYISEDMILHKLSDDWSAKEFLDSLPDEVIIPEDESEKVDIFADDIFAINLNAIDSVAKANNHIHYLKWNLTNNLSVRYFYSFDTKLEMVGKFGLKNHKHKQLTEISEETAKEMICSFCVEKFDEIIGYNVKGFGFKKYVKKFGEDFKTLKNDKEVK